MNSATDLERRLSTVERRLDATLDLVTDNDTRLRALESSPFTRLTARRNASPAWDSDPAAAPPPPPEPRVEASPEPRFERPPSAPSSRPSRVADAASLSDFLGGRALAWLGGIATVLGIVLLLALAIAHGWIGPAARVALAAAASTALMAAGIWLHAKRGRTEAAATMVGAATAGWFATLIVAAEAYALIPAPVAVVGSMLAGALATTLAIRWAGRVIAAIGLIGALLSPALVGAPTDLLTLALLAIGAACAMWVFCWRRWPWLAFATLLVTVPQWVLWLQPGLFAEPVQPPLLELAVLTTFGGIGLLGAVFAQARAGNRLLGSAGALVLLNAVSVGAAGQFAFGSTGGALWLVGIALVHVAAGVVRLPRLPLPPDARRVLISIGVVAGDVALASLLHGVALTAAWGAASLAFAWLARRTDRTAGGEAWIGAALGSHIALVLAQALIELPPSGLSSAPELVPLASVAILAASCLGAARVSTERPVWRMALDGLGLAAVAYMTAASTDGPMLVVAWALEAIALAELARRTGDALARFGALAFLAGAGLHAMAVEAPASGLVAGVDSLGAAALALGATALAALRVGLLEAERSPSRLALLGGAGTTALYLASLAIITAFQPAAGTDAMLVLDLSIRQQGQVLLSAMWGAVGVWALIAGLRRNLAPLRLGALGLLMVTVAKVFLYDLSTLTSIYRVVSFFVLGGLLLAGAFAYQRLRPPPRPDLRSVHPSQR